MEIFLAGKCPHDRVQFCPLYVAGHVGGLPTCMGKWDEEGCDVDHGRADYCKLVVELFRADPKMVAECAEGQNRFEAKEQRDRNMRLSGIH